MTKSIFNKLRNIIEKNQNRPQEIVVDVGLRESDDACIIYEISPYGFCRFLHNSAIHDIKTLTYFYKPYNLKLKQND